MILEALRKCFKHCVLLQEVSWRGQRSRWSNFPQVDNFSFWNLVSTLTHSQTKKINVTGSGVDLGKSYMQFVRNNMDTITKRINDDLWVLNVMEKWYFDQVQMISTWLTDRLDKTLIPYQCTCLAHVVKVGGGQ